MATALRALVVSVTADTRRYQAEMQKAAATGGQALRSVQQAGPGAARAWDMQTQAARHHATALEASSQAIRRYAGAFAGIFGAGKLIGLADEWQQINARIRLATEGTGDFATAQQRLEEIASRTYRRYSEAAEQFSQTARPMQELGFATRDTLDAAEALGLALVAGGSSAQKGATAIDAWGKSIAQGRIATEQWQTLLLQTPRVAQALADGLGKTTAELGKMASEGQLTAQVVVPALTSQMTKLRAEADALPVSMEDAGIRFREALQKWVGGANEASGATQTLISGTEAVTRNIDLLATAAVAGGIGIVGSKMVLAGRDAVQMAQGMGASRAAQIALTSARVADAREAVVAAAMRKQELVQQKLFYGELMRTTASKSELAYATRRYQAAAQGAAAATAQHQASITALTAAENANAAAKSRLAAAGRMALGVFGGPTGLAIMIGSVAASWLVFRDKTAEAESELANWTGTAAEAVVKFRELNAEIRAGELLQLSRAVRDAEQDVRESLDRITAHAHASGSEFWETYVTEGEKVFSQFESGAIGVDAATGAFASLNERLFDADGANQELRDSFTEMTAEMARNMEHADRQRGIMGQLSAENRNLEAATNQATGAMRVQAEQARASSEAVAGFVERMTQEISRGQVELARVRGGSAAALKQEFGQFILSEGGVDAFSPDQLKAVVSAYRERREQLQELEAAQARYGAAAKRASAEVTRGIADQDKWLGDLNTSYAQLAESLAREIDLYGQTGRAAEMAYTLAHGALASLSEAQKEYLIDLARQRDLQDANAAASAGYAGLRSKYASPEGRASSEIYADRDSAYMALLNGDMDAAEYDSLMERIDAKARESFANVETYADQAARNMQTALGDNLYNVLDGKFEGIADSFGEMLKRMAAELMASEIWKSLGNALAGSSGQGWWGNLARGIGGAMQGTKGGRAGGGPVAPFSAYDVTEHGDPELLSFGGRQVLMMGSKGGMVTPLMNKGGGGAGGGGPMQVIVNNHGPQQVNARLEESEGPDGSVVKKMIIDVVADSLNGGSLGQLGRSRYGWRDAI